MKFLKCSAWTGMLLIFLSASAMAQIGKTFKIGTVKEFAEKLNSSADKQLRSRRSNITLQISEKVSFNGVNNVTRKEREGTTIIGSIDGEPTATFDITYTETLVRGNLILPERKIAYEYVTEQGNVVVREIDINKVICIDYHEDPKTNIKQKRSISAVPGSGDPCYNLQSFPGATAVVKLDFDGQLVSGTAWLGGATVDAYPGNFTSYQITEIWKLVSEDFRPFKLNITTSEAVYQAANPKTRMRAIFTPNDAVRPGSGGVAYVGSFLSFIGGDYYPCWIFNSGIIGAGEAASHEIGHTLGLNHDGRSIVPAEEYYYGHGNWAPIMGVGYSRGVVQWSKGEYQNANNNQNDLDVISNYVNYRDDEAYGTQLVLDASRNVIPSQNNGVISKPDDLDYFHFYVTKTSKVSFIGTPNFTSPNLDISLQLFKNIDPNDLQLAQASTYNSIGPCTLNATIAPGHYYLRVDGTGDGNPFNTGYSDYGSLGYYEISGNIVDFCDPVPTPIITGSDQYCVNPSAHTRSFGLINASSYAAWSWTISPASSYLSIQYPNATETSTTLNVAANYTGTYTITATGSNGCGQTASASMNVTVASSAPTGAVSVVGGPATVNSTDKSIHQATLVAGKKEWEITPSGAYTNYNRLTYERVEIDWNDAYSGTASLRVRNTNGCGAGPWSASTNVTVCGSSNTMNVFGPTTIDNSENTIFQTIQVPGTKNWTISPASAVLSKTVLPYERLSVIWNPTFTGNVTVSVQCNGYCNAPPKTFTVTSGQCEKGEPNNTQATAYYIISSNPTMDPDRRTSGLISYANDEDWYSFTNQYGGSNIQITLSNLVTDFDLELYNSAGLLVGGSYKANNSSEKINFNTTTIGTYYIKVFGYNQTFSSQCYYLNLNQSSTPFARMADDEGFIKKDEVMEVFSVFPNPTESGTEVLLTIPSGDASSNQRVIITDINGKTVYETVTEFTSGQAMINPSNLKAGIYLIDIEGLGKKKLVVQ